MNWRTWKHVTPGSVATGLRPPGCVQVCASILFLLCSRDADHCRPLPFSLPGELANVRHTHVSGRWREKTGHSSLFSAMARFLAVTVSSLRYLLPWQAHDGSWSQWPLALILLPLSLHPKVQMPTTCCSLCGVVTLPSISQLPHPPSHQFPSLKIPSFLILLFLVGDTTWATGLGRDQSQVQSVLGQEGLASTGKVGLKTWVEPLAYVLGPIICNPGFVAHICNCNTREAVTNG